MGKLLQKAEKLTQCTQLVECRRWRAVVADDGSGILVASDHSVECKAVADGAAVVADDAAEAIRIIICHIVYAYEAVNGDATGVAGDGAAVVTARNAAEVVAVVVCVI